MKIKVCGMREPENIRAVSALGVDYIGLIFYPKSSRFVSLVNTNAGIIPNRPDDSMSAIDVVPPFVGVFVDEMPQTVITNAYNYKLDYIQLHGDESPVYIDNLRRTLDPDIRPGIKIIKAISISSIEDIDKCSQYENHADMLLFDTKCEGKGGSGTHFDWTLLDAYKGNLPFILSGGICLDDADAVVSLHHPQCIGVDINSAFETAPAMKDVEKIKEFIKKLKNNEQD